jgi:hypothetical protein
MQWVDSVRPRVKELVEATQYKRLDAVTVAIKDSSRSPYGSYLGSWIEEGLRGPVICSQANWALPLSLMFCYTPHWLENAGGDISATRIQMGITNDVWQPLLASSKNYSMIRHHALMLAAAWSWLPEPDKTRWLDVMRDQLDVARTVFGFANDIIDVCRVVETRVQWLWGQKSPSSAHGRGEEWMAEFYLASTIAMASVVHHMLHLPPHDVSHELVRWAIDYQREDFNVHWMRELWRNVLEGKTWKTF